jgi:AraC-like DNA-binding protein
LEALDRLLQDLHLSESFYCHSELNAPWSLAFPERDLASFHYLAEGHACVKVDGQCLALEAGDFVVLPHGKAHAFQDSPGTPAGVRDMPPMKNLCPTLASLRLEGPGERSILVCGGARLEGSAAHSLLEQLPAALRVSREERETLDWLRPTLEAIALEARHPRPGSGTVMARLADVLLIQAIRAWIARSPAESTWIRALQDPRIGRSLALMHAEPERTWDLASLARASGMSRASFAERFTALVGQPPKTYLTSWRMNLAHDWLRKETLTLAEVAGRLGYGSEAAFSRAYKRHFGMAPGSHRKVSFSALSPQHPGG